jgi:hypothetical protein
LSEEAQQYGRHGFDLNGLFVEDGIVRSFHRLDRGGYCVVQDEDTVFGIDAYPLVGLALCEFPDEDRGAVHACFVLVALAPWGVALYDKEAPSVGDGFLGVSYCWPHDRAKWIALHRRLKGLPVGEEDTEEPQFERTTLAAHGINPVTGERLGE